jgi:hypothetical protein
MTPVDEDYFVSEKRSKISYPSMPRPPQPLRGMSFNDMVSSDLNMMT